MMKAVTQLIWGNVEEEIPNEIYRNIQVIPKEAQIYFPVVLDEVRLRYYKETTTKLCSSKIQIEDDILFIIPDHKLKSNELHCIESFIEHSVPYVESIQLVNINNADNAFYNYLLPLYLENKFHAQFVIDQQNKRIIFQQEIECTKEDIIKYINSLNVKPLKLNYTFDNEQFHSFAINDFISFENFKTQHSFEIPIQPSLTFILRKYNSFIKREMKRYCVVAQNPEMMKGNYQLGDNHITCYTFNSLVKDMFLNVLNRYCEQVQNSTLSYSFDYRYIKKLCKSFNIQYQNEIVAIRFINSSNFKSNCVSMMYIEQSQFEKYFLIVKKMAEEHKTYPLDSIQLTNEQQNYFIQKGVIFDKESHLIHSFSRQTSTELSAYENK
ncbi:hypothetical protein KM1_216550 [Entamoeba histolytica HM-3:IMSS]|uniref:Uncharacterized protein n=5 Tax=Entamoeba histolytica TaxID=5759 RepID=C4LW48_ENTH1|nr:hypothetical protein EHI_142030 [Entamoeba histolytica HM-1:IMSS]EAL45386.1 hypothetical protein EHI_142030 [Entamoeba histolytica HM-1:IMSS]EMS12440.1 hypothetical protein KM1_216550 [Entamoeba histolytica HM-3:IMSS]ENY62936.1 hypothetical protein EHI7A_129340 [Entamoeba histolytica HM-1:IMSS-A]GAT92921.1 hypothetical protein CL6EHI_142030 [Entamoeba histolytica]|eukprot:XP_650776.1 hypothetical protein EHI_142030 [Entamoeba histolytica HM-1:IMSS]